MNVLITGGTGFIGSHVAERLCRMGHDVTILRRPGSTARVPVRGARLVPGDVTDPSSLRDAFASQEAVVHAAGLVGSGEGARAHRHTNALGTRNVVRAAIAAGVPRLVHLSSLIVHATPAGDEPIRETSPLRRHVAAWEHYARTKLLAEREVRRAGARDGITTIVIRPGVVLGPRDRWTTPWMLRALERPPVLLAGSGENRIPCVVVEELAEAIARAAAWRGLESDVFDLAGSTEVTQRELVEWHACALGRTVASIAVPTGVARAAAWLLDAIALPGGPGALPTRRMAVAIASAEARVDCARAAIKLGWRGTASCQDAIRRAVAWERPGPGGALGRTLPGAAGRRAGLVELPR